MSISQVLEPLKGLDAAETVILCIGNRLKGDDAAACFIYDLLKDKTKAEIIDAGSVPENYIGLIIKKAPQNVIIIDAADFAASAGSVMSFGPHPAESFSISTHSVSLKLLYDCIRSEINCSFFFAGIQPAQTGFNKPLSPKVRTAVEKIADELIKIFG